MKNSKQKHTLQKDEKGLSTMEYAVLFVVIVVGALVAWGALGEDLQTSVTNGTKSFNVTVTSKSQGSADEAN
jgi:Flp pilus assembly pilin Flp